jgi:hypothetical protein
MPAIVIPRIVSIAPVCVTWHIGSPTVIVNVPYIAVADIPVVGAANNESRVRAVETHHQFGVGIGHFTA